MKHTYVVTQDPKLLDKYYRLREVCFREELGIPDFDGGEDDYDRRGTVILALGPGGRVLAGARIYGNGDGQSGALPIETPTFQLAQEFPDLTLDQGNYCTWGRFVIAPEVRSNTFAQQFIERVSDVSAAMGYRFAFVVTDKRRSRYYRRLYQGLGYDYQISKVEVPCCGAAFQGLEHLVSYAVLPSADSVADRVARASRQRAQHADRFTGPVLSHRQPVYLAEGQLQG